jgi:hypothetical protein
LDEFVDPLDFYFGHLVWHEDPQISKDWFTHLLFWIVLVGFPTLTILVLKTAGLYGGPSHVSMPIHHQVLKSSGGEHWSSVMFFFWGWAGQDINSPSDDFDFGLKWFEGVFLVIEQSLSI